VRAQNTF